LIFALTPGDGQDVEGVHRLDLGEGAEVGIIGRIKGDVNCLRVVKHRENYWPALNAASKTPTDRESTTPHGSMMWQWPLLIG
jgi:hypothetical protein